MPERSLLLTTPIPVAGPLAPAQLELLVAADAQLRSAEGNGRDVRWAPVMLPGGLGSQHAAQQDLLREGLDPASLSREELVARVRAVEEEGCIRLQALAGELGVRMDVAGAAEAAREAAGAARTAFVRLFDAGILVEAEQVVDVCPRCCSVVSPADAIPDELAGEALTLRLALVGGEPDLPHVEVRSLAVELLPGAVAVAVPEGHPAAGRSAVLPVVAAVVPVLPDPSVAEPLLLVPGHDASHLETSRRLGLVPLTVVDTAGTIHADGPLDGLARYAARSAVRQLLEAEGALAGVDQAGEPAARCQWCRTVLVAVLGRHWFLAMAGLETAAADAVRDGRLAVSPPAAREEMLARAGTGADWCVSQQVWAGEPVPVGRCRDCGQLDVAVHHQASCGSCMGDLVAEDDVMDPRFVGCMWPLSAGGWPEGGRSLLDGATSTLLVGAGDIVPWVIPMAALGLRLSGSVPFGEVAVLPAPDPAPDGP